VQFELNVVVQLNVPFVVTDIIKEFKQLKNGSS